MYPLSLARVERTGRTEAELDEVICWLTGFDEVELQAHLDAGTTFVDFFAAGRVHSGASRITGVVCGVRVDELTKGRPLVKILRD